MIASRRKCLLLSVGLFICVGGNTSAQNNNNNNQNVGGITIDADGIVSRAKLTVRSTGLAKKRQQAYAKENLSQELSADSTQRSISLVRMEKELKEHVEQKKPLPDALFYLAGLQRIDYVFVYPDEQDIVIAGPAGAFGPDAEGRMVGVESGRPPLRLDDLVMAMRAIRAGNDVGCSIDPVPANMSAMQQYIRKNSSPTSTSAVRRRYQNMARILGKQKVSVYGVPLDSHFSATLVEADYRMKRLSLGLETVRVKGFRSHLSMLRPGGNSVQRWWFTPLYDAFYTTPERDAFELAGQRAQLSSQEEVVNSSGNRSSAGMTRVTTQAWSKLFTDKFPEIAEASPVFAELQNLIDLLIVSALLEDRNLPQKVGWKREFLLSNTEMPFPKYNPPKQVQSLVNIKSAGRGMMLGLVGGGVTIRATRVAKRVPMEEKPERRLVGKRNQSVSQSKDGDKQSWWWD